MSCYSIVVIQLALLKLTCALTIQPESGNNEATLDFILKISSDQFITVCPWDNQMMEQVVEFINSSYADNKAELDKLDNFHLDFGRTSEYSFDTLNIEGLSSRHWLNRSAFDNNETEIVFHKKKGGATLRLEDGREVHVRQEDYCLSRANSTGVTVKSRSLDCSNEQGHSCVQKCCPIGHVLNIKDNGFHCTPSTHNEGTWWIPQFPEFTNVLPISVYDRSFDRDRGCAENPHARLFGHPLSSKLHSEYYPAHAYYNFSVTSNGSVEVVVPTSEGGDHTYTVIYGNYCIDGVQDSSDPSLSYSGLHTDHLVLVECNVPVTDENLTSCGAAENTVKVVNKVYLIFIPFATLFIVLTIIVYTLLWKTHNIHGKTLYGFLIGTLGFYVFLFLTRAGIFDAGGWECRTVAIGFHFFFLSYIAWLSAVNFDVWYTFRYLKAKRATHKTGRVVLYSLFAFGLPMIIVATSVILDNSLGDKQGNIFVRPKYGEIGPFCIFTNQAIRVYLVIPLGILLVTNIAFFSWTIVILRQYQRSISAILKGTSLQSEDNSYGDIKTLTILRQKSLPMSNGCRELGIAQILPRVRLGVFVKIFVLTGVTWIFDVIGWFTMSDFECGKLKEGLTWVFVIVDTFNILLAVAIFFLFVWKQSIFDELWNRYPRLNGFLDIFILGKLFEKPKEKKMSITMSTLGRSGTISTTGSRPPSRTFSLESRKISSESGISGRTTSIGSLNSNFDKDSRGRRISFDMHRKFSSDSRKASIESRKISSEIIRKNSMENGEKEVVVPTAKRKSSGSSMCFTEGPELPVVLEEGDGLESSNQEDLKA